MPFPLEDPSNDMAIIEIDPSVNRDFSVSIIPVNFRPHQNGEKVLTFGFSAPKVSQTKIDQNLNWLERNFLKRGMPTRVSYRVNLKSRTDLFMS